MADTLWRECANWLARCKIIRDDNYPANAEVMQFAQTLRDGVLLCHLVQKLDPEALDFKDVCLRPQMAQCMCLKNIRTFLQACRKHFDLKENDLFDPGMLYDYSNFAQVLHTLSKLSKSAKVARLGIGGFPIHSRHFEEEEVYKNLEDIDHGLLDVEEIEEADKVNVYTELCYITFKGRESAPGVSPFPTSSAPMEKRDYTISELIETEKNYIDVLNMIKTHFLKPLSECIFVSEEEVKCIFFCIERLYAIHKEFHSELMQSCALVNGLKLSQVIINWKEKFLIYGDICSNLPMAHRCIDVISCKNKLVADEIERCQQRASDGRFKLKHLITVPTQRVLKYHLLLKELCKNTPETNDDYQGLQSAYECMVDVAEYTNEVKRDNEMLQIISEVQDSISDWKVLENACLRDYGRLLKDGELKIRSHEDGSRQKLRYVFVFNKAVIFCKTTRGEPYSYRSCLLLDHYKLEDHHTKRTLLGREASWTHQWFLVDNQNKAAITLYAKTLDAKEKWIRSFNEALEQLHPSEGKETDHDYVMHTFSTPTNCDVCKKLFKGIFFQGYKCTSCNLFAHKKCLNLMKSCGVLSPPPPPPRPNPVRVAPVTVFAGPQHNNSEMERYPWFAGQMNRMDAEATLRNTPKGTFLLRRSKGYALSLRTGEEIKHMRVFNNRDSVYLSEAYPFPSIVKLVDYYEGNSLRNAFRGLNAVLEVAWKCLFHTAKVVADYTPEEFNLLPIARGQHLIIISKEGDATGWWKGRFGDQEGYFPKEYVEEDGFSRG